jgi:glycosyltransferase involved in cell wall biosynthesis
VMEAICRGVPAIVSSTAGVAELYPEHLRAFQVPNPEDRRKLAGLIREWYSDSHKMRELFEPFSARLRNRTLSAMAEEIIGLSESGGSRSTSFSNSI